MKIDLFTFLGPNSAAYAEFLKYTCDTFASGKHEINWKCIESVGCDRIPDGYKLVAKAKDMHHNSMSHAVGINMAQKYVENDYVVFIDVDMAILHDGWDDIIVKELDNYDCFGGSYAHGSKYKNFPTVYIFTFRADILNKIELDFRPKLVDGRDSVGRHKVTEKDAEIFGHEIGRVIKCDTGWKLPLIIKGAGLSSNSMPMILMSDKRSLLPFENEKHKKICMQNPSHMCEWHYNGKLFTTHKQACRNHPIDGKWGAAWRKRIELYIGGINE